MKTKTKILLVTASMLAIACAKEDDSSKNESAPGACSTAVIDARNAIDSTSKTFLASQTMENARQIHYACVSFKAAIGESTCQAMDVKTGETVNVSYSGKVKEACDQIAASVN